MIMSIKDAMKRTVRDLLRPDEAAVDGAARAWAAKKAEIERAAAARVQAIQAARLVYDDWRRPQLELERLEQTHAAATWTDAGALAPFERPLLEARHRRPELLGFDRWLARVRALLSPPVPVEEHIDHFTDARTVTNLDDHARRDRALAAVVAAGVELRDVLWTVTPAAARARIAELRAAIEREIPESLLDAGELDMPLERAR
jgi:hypothetical protein